MKKNEKNAKKAFYRGGLGHDLPDWIHARKMVIGLKTDGRSVVLWP